MIEGLLQPAHLMVLLMILSFPFLFILLPIWRILVKAGYAGPISLLALIPVVGITIVLFWLAFNEWPLESAAKRSGAFTPTVR